MISVIEKQYMETVIRMGKRLQSGEPDWEQRRYEIAKDCLAASMPDYNAAADRIAAQGTDPDQTNLRQCAVDVAVELANALIAKLQEKK